MRQLNFRLPDPEPPQPGWGVVGIVLNVAALLLLTATVGRTVVTRIGPAPTDPGGGFTVLREFELTPYIESESVALPGTAGAISDVADTASGPAFVVTPRVVPIGVQRRPTTLAEYDPVVGSAPIIGTSTGTGKLWVGPLEGRIGVVGPSPNVATHVARVDSAIKALVLAFIDTMPADSFFTPPMAAPWVTQTEDGKTWGVDQSWIYLGDFKLPSPLLALIPLPQGNIDLARQEGNLLRIRDQIMRAARQAQTNEDMRHYIKEIRKRKDAEREAKLAAQKGVKRDTIKPIPRR